MKVPKRAWYSGSTEILVVAENRKRAAKLYGCQSVAAFDGEFQEVPGGNKDHLAEGLYQLADGVWHEVITPACLSVTNRLRQIAACIRHHGIRIAIEFDPKRPPPEEVKCRLAPYLGTTFDLILSGRGSDPLQKQWKPRKNP